MKYIQGKKPDTYTAEYASNIATIIVTKMNVFFFVDRYIGFCLYANNLFLKLANYSLSNQIDAIVKVIASCHALLWFLDVLNFSYRLIYEREMKNPKKKEKNALHVMRKVQLNTQQQCVFHTDSK